MFKKEFPNKIYKIESIYYNKESKELIFLKNQSKLKR